MRLDGYDCYSSMALDVPYSIRGSAYDRLLLRIRECTRSALLTHGLLSAVDAGDWCCSLLSPDTDSMLSTICAYMMSDGPYAQLSHRTATTECMRGRSTMVIVHGNSGTPVRLHYLRPSYHHLQAYTGMLFGLSIPDMVAYLGS